MAYAEVLKRIIMSMRRSLTVRDIDIRQALLAEMQMRHSKEPGTRVVEELSLCQGVSRVDIAVVNGSLSGYEIKSEKDTLDRLPAQRDVYSLIFDYVTVVASRKHVSKVMEIVPDWWGIDIAESRGQKVELKKKRKARLNKEIQPQALVQLLWKDEALSILESKGLAVGYRSKSKKIIWSHLAENLTPTELRALVRQQLKVRANWRVDAPQT